MTTDLPRDEVVLSFALTGAAQYSGTITATGKAPYSFGPVSRAHMVSYLVGVVKSFDVAPRVGVACLGITPAQIRVLHRHSVEALRRGEHVVLGGTEVVDSPNSPIRQIPGTTHYECFYCGGPCDADAEALTCKRCTKITPLDPQGRIDCATALLLYPETTRFFVNKPWNPRAPWMSRSELEILLQKES